MSTQTRQPCEMMSATSWIPGMPNSPDNNDSFAHVDLLLVTLEARLDAGQK